MRPGIAFEDLVQTGMVGLLKAARSFDPARGVRFQTYAFRFIVGEIRHYYRDTAETMRVPRWVQKLYSEYTAAVGQLQDKLGRAPTPSEIADRMNITEAGVREIIEAHHRSRVVSLADASRSLALRRELIAHQRYETFKLPVEDRIVLLDALERLSEVQRKVVYYLFFMDLTQTAAARRLGISQKHVSRLLAAALKQLRSVLRV